MDDNKNKPMGWPILYTLATLAGVAVLAILKACGIISMSWPVVIAGLVWVPTALLLITLWVATLLIWIGRTEKKIREYNRKMCIRDRSTTPTSRSTPETATALSGCTRPTSRSAGRTQTTRMRLWKLLYTQSERTTEARTRPKAPRGRTASNTTCSRSSALIRATTIQT